VVPSRWPTPALKFKKKMSEEKIVKISVSLSIGLQGRHEDVLDYPASEVPDREVEKQDWLEQVWKEWAYEFIDGGASIEC
jgi:hypothetical protein